MKAKWQSTAFGQASETHSEAPGTLCLHAWHAALSGHEAVSLPFEYKLYAAVMESAQEMHGWLFLDRTTRFRLRACVACAAVFLGGCMFGLEVLQGNMQLRAVMEPAQEIDGTLDFPDARCRIIRSPQQHCLRDYVLVWHFNR